MARVPFIGRLFWYVTHRNFEQVISDSPVLYHRREYLALFGSFVLIFLEGFIRIITLGLRACLDMIHFFGFSVNPLLF